MSVIYSAISLNLSYTAFVVRTWSVYRYRYIKVLQNRFILFLFF